MRHLLLPVFCLLLAESFAQQNPAIVDSFKSQLSKAKTPEERVFILSKLTMTLMNTNIPEADKYGEIMNREAEISRKRDLIVKALLSNGLRYSVFTGNKNFLQKALEFYNQALEISKKNNLKKETAESLLSISAVYMSIPDLEKSMNYTTQANSIVTQLKNDSLTVATEYSYGAIHQLRKNKIEALKKYLIALRKAEEINNPILKRSCYTILSQFYSDIKEYDKAIDYATKSSEQLPLTKVENAEYTAVMDLYLLGDLYMKKKDFNMAMYYYDSSIKKADEINFQPLKMPGYRGILNQFLQSKQPEKALEYFNKRTELKTFVTNFGSGHVIDNSYAIIYKQLGRYDSAGYYFQKAAPGFENTSTASGKMSFYFAYADFYDKSGNSEKSIEYYNKALTLADQTKDLEWQQRIVKELDTIYAKKQNYERSRYYGNLYHNYKDSLQKLAQEKLMIETELEDEELRQKRIADEAAAALERKHSVQYMAITIGIAVVFLLLVIMGAFKVSEATIKIMGFFAFIFLFEFIIMIADTKIHHYTHGEPLPLLLIKIVLIAILLPLHHWLEHKVVHYLASRRLILPDRKSIWRLLLPKKPVH